MSGGVVEVSYFAIDENAMGINLVSHRFGSNVDLVSRNFELVPVEFPSSVLFVP